MATLTIKNVPGELYQQLKRSAAEHRRSINSEVIVCLERALHSTDINTKTTLASARRLRKRTVSYRLTDEILFKAKNEGRL